MLLTLRRKTDGAKVLDKIYGVVYNIGNHEIDCVHSDTQMKSPKVAAFGVFFWDHAGLTFCYAFGFVEIS